MPAATPSVGEASLSSEAGLVAVPASWAASTGVQPASLLDQYGTVWPYSAENFGRGAAWAQVCALAVGDPYIDAATLATMPRLRVISVDGTGFADQVDMPAASSRGVAVCNVRDYAADAVAEFTLGLIIALRRHLITARDTLRAGSWSREQFFADGLRGATLGVVGLGSTGSRVAELALAFGMNVLCATAHPGRRRSVPAGVSFVSLDELLVTADVVTLHAALSPATAGLIGTEQLARVRPSAVLVNTARGALVDEAALLAALRDGRLAGAALDVTHPEPIAPDSPLLKLDNVLVTPHIAAATRGARRQAIAGCLRNIRNFLSGRPENVVNPEAVGVR
jgi:phosphoglycerate dehydrogenase-like enzyme